MNFPLFFFYRLYNTIRSSIETDVARRRDYLKQNASDERANSAMQLLLPDYTLAFAVPVLTHDPNFTDPTSLSQLRQIEKCLWLILEPLVNNKEYFCFSFYKILIDRMKNHKDALNPQDEATNHVRLNHFFFCFKVKLSFFKQKMYAICDMAMHLILSRVQTPEVREYTLEYIRIPDMFFQPQPDSYQNTKIYIPSEIFNAKSNITGVSVSNVSLISIFFVKNAKKLNFQTSIAKVATKTKLPEDQNDESAEPPTKRALRGN